MPVPDKYQDTKNGCRDRHRHPSEIRLVCVWYGAVLGHVGRAGALDTDHLRPLAKARQWPAIGHGRRPWRREHAFILDPELKLESLTRVGEVARESRIRCVEMKGFPFAPGFSLNRCVVIQQPITFKVPYWSTLAKGPILTPTVSTTNVSPS